MMCDLLEERDFGLQRVVLQWLKNTLEVLDVHHEQLALLRASACGSPLPMALQHCD